MKTESFIFGILGACLLGFMFWTGATFKVEEIASDCEKMHQFRMVNKIYTCMINTGTDSTTK